MKRILVFGAFVLLALGGVATAAVVTELHPWSVNATETHTCSKVVSVRHTTTVTCTVTDQDNYSGTITDEDTLPDPPTTTTPPTVTTEPPHTTEPPTTTTEPPTTTTEPPPTNEYPNASNTGVTNEAALRYWPGHEPGANAQPVYIQTDGQVIENYIFRRVVIVYAKNVTFRNVRFKHDRDFYMLISESTPDGNILVEDSEFDGMGAAQINAAVAGPGWTLKRVDIQGVQDGAKLQNNTNVYDSWIHNLWVTCDLGAGVPGDCEPHYDGLQNLGGAGNVVKHNTIDAGVGRGRNAAVMMRGYCAGGCISTIANVLVEDNILRGGGWTVMCCGPEPNLRYSNIVIRNNKFGPFAYGSITTGGETRPEIVTTCGNVRESDGAPIDAPC